jgi:peptidoglycan/xylan/chitin deacetylase (PgdA/CDA1 family)
MTTENRKLRNYARAVTRRPGEPAQGLSRPRGATILVYHAIGECPGGSDPENLFISPSVFAAQMAFLARRRRVVGLDAVIAGKWIGNGPAVALTFDDGFRSVLREAAPVLRDHGFPATVFVPTSWFGRRAGWYDAPGCETEIMSEDELLEARAAGIEVESHGADHLDLGRAAPSEVEDDIARSIETLARLLGTPPRYLAYPYGSSSEAAERAAEAAGLDAAFTVDRRTGGLFGMPRVGVTALDGSLAYRAKTSGRYLRWRHSPAYGLYRALRPLLRSEGRRRRAA